MIDAIIEIQYRASKAWRAILDKPEPRIAEFFRQLNKVIPPPMNHQHRITAGVGNSYGDDSLQIEVCYFNRQGLLRSISLHIDEEQLQTPELLIPALEVLITEQIT